MSNPSSEYDNKIVVGDVGSVLRDAPFLSIDCVVTSPPYFNLRKYTDNDAEIGREETVDEYLENLVNVFGEAARHMHSMGSIWVNLGDNFDEGQPKLVPWKFMFAMIERGFQLRNIVMWYKVDAMSESTTRRFSQKYEPFFWFTISDSYYFNYEAATIPCRVSTVERMENPFYHNKGHDVSRMAGMIGDMRHKVDDYLERGVNAGDIWPIMCNHEKVKHSAPYPVELIVRPIVATCPPGGLVFDPFMGSGTTALAVTKIGGGRRFYGTDINPESVEEARGRIAEDLAQGQLF